MVHINHQKHSIIKRHRCKRSQNEVRGGTGKMCIQVGHPIKHDERYGPKTTPSGLQKYPPCFTSIFFCTTVLASGFPPQPTVSLFCHFGKCLASYFHALFSVSPLPLRTPGDRLRILSSLFCLLKNPMYLGDTCRAPSFNKYIYFFCVYTHNSSFSRFYVLFPQYPEALFPSVQVSCGCGTILIYEILNKIK